MSNSELILMFVVPFALATLISYFLPRFSRGFLGPAMILLTVVACVMLTKELENSDAWGAPGIIVVFVGAMGVTTGLILIIIGAVRASRSPRPKPEAAEPEEVTPFRLPRPGLFTPERLFVVIALTPILAGLVVFLYSCGV